MLVARCFGLFEGYCSDIVRSTVWTGGVDVFMTMCWMYCIWITLRDSILNFTTLCSVLRVEQKLGSPRVQCDIQLAMNFRFRPSFSAGLTMRELLRWIPPLIITIRSFSVAPRRAENDDNENDLLKSLICSSFRWSSAEAFCSHSLLLAAISVF